ncbi:MAG: BTAD domain-containing putative transcriptional regulator [Natronosporangium sp.]
MRFDILGPLQVSVESAEIQITARRERVLMAALLTRVNRTVSRQRLIDSIWAERVPRDAVGQLQGSVYRLRRALTAAGAPRSTIVTEAAGYRAQTDPRCLDLTEFYRLRDQARRAAEGSRAEEARHHYRSALRLWRGPALDGVDSDLIRREAAVLDEEHFQALAECLDLELALGHAGELIAELGRLVKAHPFRETVHRQFMLALYRAGRQSDALAVYRDLRRVLQQELGTEPGAELERLHQAILNRDPDLDRPSMSNDRNPATPEAAGREQIPVPRELPADVAGFTGRAGALKVLDEMYAGAERGAPAPVVITAITGTAGVGKTALAVHWAHRAADLFPEGQLFLNLRGYADEAAARPIEALAALLRSLGVPPEQIPPDEAQAAALYRSRLAGRRTLVVLDNAGSVEQVRPLLPGSPGSMALVTSRDRLQGLAARDGARRVTLDVLAPDEAYELLSRLLGVERVQAEPAEVASLAEVCGYLPLALRVAAASLADRRPIADLVARLTHGDRLAQLTADDDQASAVRATFDLSYRRLPVAERRLFRLLGLLPGPDVTPSAAAALVRRPVVEASTMLGRLAGAHLLDEHVPGRYALHDLLRQYASQLAVTEESGDQREVAQSGVYSWYLQCCDRAAGLLYPQMLRLPTPPADSSLPPAEFDGAEAAMAWLEAERSNLVAAIESAAEQGPRQFAWLLADSLRGYFWYVRHRVDWLTVALAGWSAAAQEGGPQAQTAAGLGLGTACNTMADYARAISHLLPALKAGQRADWPAGHAAVLGNLGIAYWSLGRLSEAEAHCEQALAVGRAGSATSGELNHSLNLGLIRQELGQLERAHACTSHALLLARQLEYRLSEAVALLNLGGIDHERGRLDLAYAHYATALSIVREIGDRHGEAVAIAGLASVDTDRGRWASSHDHAVTAATLLAGIGDRPSEAAARNTLGTIHLRSGEPRRAADQHRRALDLAREIGARRPEVMALLGLAAAAEAEGDGAEASSHAQLALDLARTTGYAVPEGQALTVLSRLRHAGGDLVAADRTAQQALEIHRKTGHRLGEASTLVVLGHLRRAAGGVAEADADHRAARELFTEIGAPLPDGLT